MKNTFLLFLALAFIPTLSTAKVVYFTGQAQENSVKLSWKFTPGETVYGVVMERSDDGEIFFPLEWVPLVNEVRPNQYEYRDKSPLQTDVVYYRLQVIQPDDDITFSDPLRVEAYFPPIQTSFDPENRVLQVLNATEVPIEARLISFSQNVVFQHSFGKSPKTERHPLPEVPPGKYLLLIEYRGTVILEKQVDL